MNCKRMGHKGTEVYLFVSDKYNNFLKGLYTSYRMLLRISFDKKYWKYSISKDGYIVIKLKEAKRK